MNRKIAFFFAYFLLLALSFNFFIFYPEKFVLGDINSDSNREINSILVKYKNSPEVLEVKIAQPQDYGRIIESYRNLADVEYAEPNYLYRASLIPSDTYFTNQWYLQKIKAVEIWDKLRESPQVIIAILDSGLQTNHPDLASNLWLNKKEIAGNKIDDDKNGFIDDLNGWDFVNEVADPSPKFKPDFTEAGILHGTIVAGIAAASGNNAAGIAGLTWKAQIMPLKVLDDKGEGNTLKVVKAVDYAVANGAQIINLSFVGFGFSKSLDDAIGRAYQAGVIVVAAAGNERAENEGVSLDQMPMYPICHDGVSGENRVIGVAATDTLDQKTNFSSFGFKCLDIAAPGISIFSTVVYSPTNYFEDKPFNKYYDGYWSGTSVAVPMVSGTLALILAANPGLNRQQIIKILLESTDNINRLNPKYLNQLGKGRLNVKAAVDQALDLLTKQRQSLLVAPMSNYQSLIKVTDQNGKEEKEFLGFNQKFLGGASLASGDVNGDGQAEIIIAAGPGGGPHVRIFNLKMELASQFFAYEQKFIGGINIVAIDLDSDGQDEIITAPASNSEPLVKIFNYRGQLKNSFLAFDKNFKGGVNLAAGDVDGDDINEIVVGAGFGGGPQVRIFKSDGRVQGQFFAYLPSFRGGVKVAVADINGGVRASRQEIITAAGKGGGPHLKIFDHQANLLAQFFAFNPNFRGGVNLAAGDLDRDGLAEIAAAAGPGGAPHIRVFETNGTIIGSFYAYEEKFAGGVNVAVIKINND